MIQVLDSFLSKEVFSELQKYCSENQFGLVKAGDKSFSVLETPEKVRNELENRIHGHKISLCFIRRAYKGFDNELRIHCDGIIAGLKTSYASVLYINDNEGVTKNGTAFYKHNKHGSRLEEYNSDEEFNRLILEDSNDESKWSKTSFISSEPNRLLTYEADMFHAKYPNEIEKGERYVLVCFYTKE